MKVLELVRSTPVRLAATFTLLFTATSFALFAILYFGIGSRLEENIRHRIKETSDTLSSLDSEKTFDELVDIINRESSSVRDTDLILMLVDKNGRFIAGNIQEAEFFDGWKRLKHTEIKRRTYDSNLDEDFVATWKRLTKGNLLIGIGDREVRQLHSYLLDILFYDLLFIIFVTASVSLYLAARARQRIRFFATTLNDLSEGKIASRIPLTGSGDDVDQVAVQVNKALSLLQKLVENVNQSSSDIAHDLKKPIGRLRQRLDEAARSFTTSYELRSAIEDAINELDSVTNTFDALLRITQIEAGARRSRFKSVDLIEILKDIWEVYAPVAEDSGHKLVLNLPNTGALAMKGDYELIVQLFANLIENSICHCSSGAIIGLTLEKKDNTISVTVADNGPGIPEHERENVFRRLYRLEAARSTPGSGLGLSLAKAIAVLHDATLILSDNNPGLKVSVEFPKQNISNIINYKYQ